MAHSENNGHFNGDSGTDCVEQARLNQQKLIDDVRFRRCYRMLHFVACRVPGGSERAEEIIERARRTASRHPQRFEYEGEFRGWLLRVLIDEALTLLRENVPTPTPKALRQPAPAAVSRSHDVSEGERDIHAHDRERFFQECSMALK
jgi:DNA-directed RNA polymerase specialized sigma24 family protein